MGAEFTITSDLEIREMDYLGEYMPRRERAIVYLWTIKDSPGYNTLAPVSMFINLFPAQSKGVAHGNHYIQGGIAS